MYLLIALVAVGAAAGGYYFKVYKPKHEYDDEDEMEAVSYTHLIIAQMWTSTTVSYVLISRSLENS